MAIGFRSNIYNLAIVAARVPSYHHFSRLQMQRPLQPVQPCFLSKRSFHEMVTLLVKLSRVIRIIKHMQIEIIYRG
jgi:hypothetical protein